MCACVCRPEADTGYLLQSLSILFLRQSLTGPGTCIQGGQKSTLAVNHQELSILVFEIGSLASLQLADSDRLAGQ